MERQLKERLIGAAVLIAIAVVLVPEMFSGSPSRTRETPAADTANPAQLKTYQIELQPGSVVAPPVQQAPPVVVAATRQSESSSEASSAPAESSASASAQSSSQSSSQPSSQIRSSASVSSLASSSQRSSSSVSSVAQKQPAVAPVSPVNVTKKTDSGQWAVQIGSFGTKDKAQQVAGKLASLGFKSSVTPVKTGDKTLYRVRTGAIAERAAANSALKKIDAAFPGASVVPLR